MPPSPPPLPDPDCADTLIEVLASGIRDQDARWTFGRVEDGSTLLLESLLTVCTGKRGPPTASVLTVEAGELPGELLLEECGALKLPVSSAPLLLAGDPSCAIRVGLLDQGQLS